MNLLNNILLSRPKAGVVAGTSVQTGSAVDMLGYDGCLFIAALGALTATQVTSMKIQSSSDDAAADAYADITGAVTANMADADSDKLLVVDVFRPAERYLKPILTRGTANAVLDGIIAIRYRGRKAPVTQAAVVSSGVSVYGV